MSHSGRREPFQRTESARNGVATKAAVVKQNGLKRNWAIAHAVAPDLPYSVVATGDSVIQPHTEMAVETLVRPPVETLVRPPQERDYQAWDEFVTHHPLGTPFHLMAWRKSIEATFGYRPFYLMAVEGERVRGVLPLFLVDEGGVARERK